MLKEEVIRLLNQDLEDEHAAIIQYLGHAYAIGEGEIACEIEAIARDEMRHLDWLVETIIGLGGTPSLERGKERRGGATVPVWMENDVRLEEGAIKQYRAHIALIDDPKIKRLLKRILSDELAHRGQFEHFVAKSDKEGLVDIRGERKDSVASFINWGIEHEYTVVLQYLWHGYLAGDAEMKRQLHDQAVNEMQHLGWLSEEMVDSGGRPRIEHTEVYQPTRAADMLRADIEIEEKVAGEYDRAAREFADPNLKKLMARLRDNERYHAEVFKDLLKEAE